MTYGELLAYLSHLDPLQLNETVTVQVTPDEFFGIERVDVATEAQDVLDVGHLYLKGA